MVFVAWEIAIVRPRRFAMLGKHKSLDRRDLEADWSAFLDKQEKYGKIIKNKNNIKLLGGT